MIKSVGIARCTSSMTHVANVDDFGGLKHSSDGLEAVPDSRISVKSDERMKELTKLARVLA